MFERMKRGWNIVEASWDVLKRHPRLLLFPVISGIALLVVIGAIGLSTRGVYAHIASDNQRFDDPVLYAILFAFYLGCTFVVVFFNAAMIFCVLQCFAGEELSLSAGLAKAAQRLPQIIAWTFVAATVGLLLDVLQTFLTDRLGILGDLLSSLADFAWGVVTYFVVPVLVVEGAGPIEAVKRSSAILRRTWGEALTGEGGLGIISFLLTLPAIGIGAALWFALGGGAAAITAIAAIVVPYLLLLTVIFSALGTVFRAGTYVYATTGEAPGNMDPALLSTAFHTK